MTLVCRYGHQHEGDYAAYDVGHCNCDHPRAAWWIDDDDPEVALCGNCGYGYFAVSDMPTEVNFRGGVRGQYYERYQQWKRQEP